MPRLIHLNGPSRVGKSTLARRYAEEHPRCLLLDLDALTGFIGGWQEDFPSALDLARPLGSVMAARHLRDGHDVVMPQLVTSHDTGPGPDDVAREVGADYIEVALLVDEDEHLRRLRRQRPASDVESVVQRMLTDPQDDLVPRIREHLAEYLAGRPETIRLDTTRLTDDVTYERLLELLEQA